MDTRTLIVALLCLAVGAGLGWFLAGGGAEHGTDAGHLHTPEDPAAGGAEDPVLDSATAVEANRAKALDDAEETIRSLSAQLEEARAQVERLTADAEAGRLAGGKTEAAETRYRGGRFEKTLQAVDWEEAGQALSRMTPLMGEVLTSRLEGKQLPPSVGDIQKYNGALVKIALKAQQEGIPGSGANGSFTHVAVVANLVHATLKHAGLPLSAAQEEKLAALADELLAEDEKRLASYGDDTLAVSKLIDETSIKDRFYAGVDALVSDEQREALHPESLRGRCSYDLFSSGLVWAQHVAPQRFADKEQLAAMLVAQVVQRYGLGGDRKPVVEEVVAAWVAALPRELVEQVPDDLEAKTGALRVSRVEAAARAQQRAFERLLQRLPADDPAAPKLRAEAMVAVPLHTP